MPDIPTSRRPNNLYVTGRLPLLVALGAVPVVLLSAAGVDAWLAAWGWVVLCALLDARRCRGRTRSARARASSGGCRAGCSSGSASRRELRLRNTGARTRARTRPRRLAADGGRARASSPRSTSRPARAATLDDPAAAAPARRAARREFVVVRSDGPLRLAGRQVRIDSRRRRPGAAAVHRPPAPAVAPRPAARARRQHERAGARAGHRVRQPARVRARRRRALDRLARDRARRRRRCCAPGARSATGTS